MHATVRVNSRGRINVPHEVIIVCFVVDFDTATSAAAEAAVKTVKHLILKKAPSGNFDCII